MQPLLVDVILTVGLFFSTLSASSLAVFPWALATRGQPAVPTGALTIAATYAESPPRLDGVLDFGEWPVSDLYQFDGGFIAVRNDALRLYILVNLLDDTTADPPLSTAPWGDQISLTFDVNGDGEISNGIDLRYTLTPGLYNLRQQLYLGPGTWSPLQQEPPRSAFASGFDCFFADASRSVTLLPDFPLPLVNCSPHRIWEFGIDRAAIGATAAAATVHFGVSATSQNPSFTKDIPPNLHYDFSALIEVALAASPVGPPAADPNATVGFQTVPFAAALEITQALQDHENSLPLVAAKATAARLYLQAADTAIPQPTTVYLYGTRQGQDLPGSPLVMSYMAPTTVDRAQLHQTANFLLPDAWLHDSVELRGRMVDAFGLENWSTPLTLTFQSTAIPTYWIVPINTNTVESPVLIDEAEIARQESYVRTVLPVSDVNFVRKGWQEVGVIPDENLAANISALKRYDRDIQLAWHLSLAATGQEPFILPDAIYGLRRGAGGLSDPVWNGGSGRVAVGGERASSKEGTMAHELIHNMDRSGSGSWGRHSPGCNASGPDPQWPYADEKIQEIGFDTRLPWSAGTTVVAESHDDLMSYCFALTPPTKWIAPYRWRGLFAALADTGSVIRAANVAQIRAELETAWYVSGEVTVDGTGHLDPIWVQSGIPTDDITPGDYAIEVQDATGNALATTPFLASFVDVEGEAVEMVHFSFQLAEIPDAAQFVLRHNAQQLDSIIVSANPPTVTLLAPVGGESWDGIQSIEWQTADPDGDPLLFTVLYSPDDGQRWMPIASNLQGNTYSVDTRVLPGSDNARIRLITTDGFHTASADSAATFRVGKKPPTVVIAQPQTPAHFASGALITLAGQASDLEDSALPDRAFTWSYGGTIFATGQQSSAVLPDGIHEVRLTVIDSDGHRGEDSIVITVGVYQSYLPLVQR